PSDAIHSPYVVGAGIQIFARSTDSKERMIGWTIESSDPTVFACKARPNGYATGACTGSASSASCSNGDPDTYPGLAVRCDAKKPGVSTLTVKDEHGNPLDSETIEVKAPDRLELLAHGPLIIGRPDREAIETLPRVLIGGTATFLVRY